MFTTQFYRPDHQDSSCVLDFIRSLYTDPDENPAFGIGEFCYAAYRDLTPPMSETLGICTDETNEVVALCWLEPERETAFSIPPRLADSPLLPDLYRHLFAFAESGLRTITPDLAKPIGITINTLSTTDAGILTAMGLHRVGDIRHHTFRALPHTAIEAPTLPPGYQFIAITDESQFEARIAVAKAVWPENVLDQTRYRNVRAAPYYRSDFDLCVQSADGTFVAFALGWLDPENRTCQFEPVGTHPDHRGKGIGKALVQHASLVARTAGAERLYIHCFAANKAGNALYAAAGYDLVGRWEWWEFPAVEETQ